MKFLEKDLEQIIFETENKLLQVRGLDIYGKKIRQVNIGNYGIADLVTLSKNIYDKEVTITIYELKKDQIGVNALFQAIRYTRGIQRFFQERDFNYYRVGYIMKFEIILVGSELDFNSSFAYVPEIFENVRLFTYSYDFDGIYFSQKSGYKLINEGF